ncbi:MAG: arylesterase [Pseudomonadota bacterium]
MMILVRLPLAITYVARAVLYKALIALILSAGLAQAVPLKLVALGDSLTHGYGLPPEDGFVPQLERWLKGQGQDVTVINMGVSGDTTEGGRARIDWALGGGADAVIVALGGNDLLRGIDPQRSRDNLDAMLGALSAKGLPVLLAGMQAPLNYGPEFKEAFDGMYPAVAEAHGAILYPSFMEGLVTETGTMEDLIQDDGIHPNAKGVALMVESIGPMVLELLARVE